MAAILIDPEQDKTPKHEGVVDNTESDSTESLYDEVEVTEEEVLETPDENAEEELPEKYRGKTIAEVARMHTEAEKHIGKQSNEVGELRQAFDEFVQSSVQTKDEVSKVEEVDFFVDPSKAVEQAIANHPKLKQAESVAVEMQKHQSLAALQTKFPDMQKTLQDPNFASWVQASPIRQRLFAAADRQYDYDSAAELLTNFAERQTVVEQTKQVEKKVQSSEIKKASTGGSRSNPDARRVKKVYRRTDIRRLMKTDPDRYEALQPDIMQAYAEGRVK